MFIKKDTRKVVEILDDPEDSRESLNLARREAEFEKDTSILCRNEYQDRLSRCAFLSLYNNKLESLTNMAVFEQSPLEQLNLGRNNLKSLPEDIGRLISLKKLWVDDNQLTDFPECILRLKNLELLKASNNFIEDVPEEIGSLTSLRELAVDNNRLTCLPSSIGKLRSLAVLVIRQNKLKTLPMSIANLTQLEELYMSSNEIEMLPSEIGNLKRLRILRVNKNYLTSVPEALADCQNLETFNCSHNNVSVLPKRLLKAWNNYIPETVYNEDEEDRSKRAKHEQDYGNDEDIHPKPLKLLFYENPVEHNRGIKLEESEWKQPLVQLWKTKSSK